MTTEVEGEAGSARVRVLFAALSSEYRVTAAPTNQITSTANVIGIAIRQFTR